MRRKKTLDVRAALVLALTATIGACADDGITDVSVMPVSLAPIDLNQPWVSVDPAVVGVDESLLEDALVRAGAVPRLRTLLAAKDGQLFLEEYYGTGVDAVQDVRSVTKSIVSTLVGLAIRDGDLDLDDTVGDLLPAGRATTTPAHAAVSVSDLLTMTGGFEWNESGGFGDYNPWIQSDDHVQMLLDRPIVDAPGTQFTYNSAAVHLLGIMLESAVGQRLPDYARSALFDPIGVGAVVWEPLRAGEVNGGSGVDLRARDLLRIGQLFLQDGMSGSRRILPEGWVGTATRPRFSWRASTGALASYTYGYLWWVSDAGDPAYLAWGFGGQFIYVVPSRRLVVVATTDWRGVSQEQGGAGNLQRQVLDIVVNGVHEAVRGR